MTQTDWWLERNIHLKRENSKGSKMPFSKTDPKSFKITPIGAAIVEAMPDRRLMNKIQREYKKTGKCPTSAIFKTQKEIDNFYKENTSQNFL